MDVDEDSLDEKESTKKIYEKRMGYAALEIERLTSELARLPSKVVSITSRKERRSRDKEVVKLLKRDGIIDEDTGGNQEA